MKSYAFSYSPSISDYKAGEISSNKLNDCEAAEMRK